MNLRLCENGRSFVRSKVPTLPLAKLRPEVTSVRKCAILVVLLIIAASSAWALDIVSEGRSDFTIVTADEPTAVAKLAARELQTYLQRITGAEVPLVLEADAPDGPCVYIGPTEASAAAGIMPETRESFIIRHIGDDLLIVGEDTNEDPLGTARTGTLYGVYELLREFGGVRWLWPGELGEVVPQAAGFRVPDAIDRRVAPDFAIRSLRLTYINPPNVRAEHMRWCRRTGQGQALAGTCGHSYSRRLGGNTRFDEHPEYYAERDGQRRPFYGEGLRAGQICTSNPEVVRVFAESCLLENRDIVSAAPNDGAGFCECANCRALDVPTNLIDWGGEQIPALTDRIFTFLNQVAAIVAEEQPEKRLGHFAYTFFKAPPAEITDLEDNIILFFAQGCHWFRDPELKATYRGYIDAWARYGNPMVSREYLGLIYWFGMPNIHTRLIEQEVRYLEERGFIGLLSEMCNDFSTHGPNYYLAARLVWDTSLTREEVLSEYYEAGFGPAATDVAEYYDIFERRLEELGPDARGSGSRNIADLPEQFDLATIARARAALQRAYEKTDDPTITARLDFVKIGLDYTDLTCQLMRLCSKLYAAGMSLGLVKTDELERQPSEQEFIEWLKEAQRIADRRWEVIKSQGELPALHTPALEEKESEARWSERIAERLQILEGEAGRYHQLPVEWRFNIEEEGGGEVAGWHTPEFDDSAWGMLATNRVWEEQGHEDFDGVGWYRVRFEVTEEQAEAEKVVLRLGAIDESGWVWLNGQQVGELIFDAQVNEKSWMEPFDLDVTGKLKPGTTTLADRVRDLSGLGGLWHPSYLIFGEEQPNLLGNGSFEDGTQGWRLSGKGEFATEVIAGEGHQSEHCLQITVPEDPTAHASIATTVPAEAEHRYGFGFHYRTIDIGEHPTIENSPAVRVIFSDAEGRSVTDTRGYSWSHLKVPKNTDDWQQATVHFTTPPGTAKISITTFFHLPGTYLVDEVSLRSLGAVE